MMVSLEALEAVVGIIFNEGEYSSDWAEVLANEAALYFNTAIICETKGTKSAKEYFKSERGKKLYEPYLFGDPMQM